MKPHDRSFYINCAVVYSLFTVSLILALFAISGPLSAGGVAVLWGVIYGWVGMLGHDAGHGQAPQRSTQAKAIAQHVLGNVTLGFSSAWWINKHTGHHKSPNHEGLDPDILIPLALSANQARERGMSAKSFRVRNAWWIFWLLLPLQAMNARISSIRYLLENKSLSTPKLITQHLTLTLHFALYAALIVAIGLQAGWACATVFLVIHQATHGAYNSLAFATNHKGMPMYPSDESPTWLELQILTSRNLKSKNALFERIQTWMYGGLNYQIEHHLFPKMPRRNLRLVRPLVIEFCRENGLKYYETGVRRSYWEVFRNFKRTIAFELIDSPMGA